MNRFVKSHGLGNDYIVLDESNISFGLTPGVIKLICHRNYGIGSDGILILVPSGKADFGLRIFAKFLYEHGYTRREFFSIDTPGGIVTAELEVINHRVSFVTVEMGEA